MVSNKKNITVGLSMLDQKMLEELQSHFEDSQSGIMKRALMLLYMTEKKHFENCPLEKRST